MKKFAGIMVATVLAFSLVACGPVDSAVQNLAGAASILCWQRVKCRIFIA